MTQWRDWLPGLDPLWPLWLLIIAAVGITVLTVWTYSKSRNKRWLWLLGLRLVAILVVALLLFRPTWQITETKRMPGKLVLLFDKSKSMAVKDEEPEGSTRFAAQLREWQSIQDLLPELEAKYQLRVIPLAFDGVVSEWKQEQLPDGGRTGLYSAILQSLEKYKAVDTTTGEQLVGIIALTDGRDNAGGSTLEAITSKLEASRAAFHSIGMGKPGAGEQQRDLIALSINAPKSARIKQTLLVQGRIQAQRFANEDVEVFLMIDGKPAMTAETNIPLPIKVTVRPTKADETKLIDFPPAMLPEVPGDARISMKIKRANDELTEENNESSTYVTLTKDGLTVLYIDKDRSWEPKFLQRALASDDRIKLFRSNPGSTADVRWRSDIRNKIKTGFYDVYIIGDVKASLFDAPPGEGENILFLIKQAVSERGSGLMMIGGYDTFGDGNWNRSPLAEPLPVQMDKKGQLEGGIGNRRDIKFLPNEDGLRGPFAFAMRLDGNPDTNLDWWKSLPPLDGGSILGSPKPGASVLAKTDQNEVLLALQEYGKGRSAAFAMDTTWKWVRPGPPRVAPLPNQPETPLSFSTEAHLRFWRQLILWLGKQEDAGQALSLELGSRRIVAGKEMPVTVVAREVTPGGSKDSAKPIPNAVYTVKVIKPNKTEEVVQVTAVGDAEGKSKGNFWRTDEPGEYEVQVSASANGKDLGSVKARFMSVRDESETTNQSANHAFLEQLSASTGGTFKLHGGLREILEKITQNASNLEELRYRLPDWREPDNKREGLLLSLFLLCICAEWLLRRWWGLV